MTQERRRKSKEPQDKLAREKIQSYKLTARNFEIIEIVGFIHRTPEDIEEGDLGKRIEQYLSYELKQLNIKDLNVEEWNINPSLVEKIKTEMLRNDCQYPPIIFDPVNNSIIDGIHRVKALQALGKKKVWAYSGKKKDYIGKENIEE